MGKIKFYLWLTEPFHSVQDGLVWDVRKGESEDGPSVFTDVKFNILMAELNSILINSKNFYPYIGMEGEIEITYKLL